MEMAVLLRIKHFEEGCRRVAFEVGSDFIDFVEQNNRIFDLALRIALIIRPGIAPTYVRR